MSVGQAVGGIVGGAIGAFFGNPILGAQIGIMAGGYIDPPKGPNIIGPRLSDRKVQVASYGHQLPRLYGTMEVAGCVFWVEGDALVEHENKQKQGGKGGSRATNTTYTYSVTFGVALAHCPARAKAGIRRIKIAGQLVYDAGSSDLDSIIASNLQNSGSWRFYDGRDDQAPDPRMQADKGINNVSGHPGLCWLAIYDLDLTEKYSNSLAAAQVQVEIVCEDSGLAVTPLLQVNADSSGVIRRLNNVIYSQGTAHYSVMQRDPWNANVTNVDFYTAVFGESHELSHSIATGIGTATICRQINVCQSDEVCALLQVTPASPFDTYSTVLLYGKTGSVLSSQTLLVADFPIYKDKTAAIDGGDWFIASREGMEIYKFHQTNITLKTAATYTIVSLGLSESFVFAVKFESVSTSTITIYKFDRSTLALVDTWTGTGDGKQATISVVSDTVLYTAIEGGTVLKWVSGAIVDDIGVCVSTTFNDAANDLAGWFSVFSESPVYVVSTSNYAGLDDYVYIGHAANARTPIKLRDLVAEECALANLGVARLDLTGLVNSDVRGYSVNGTGAVRGGLEPLQAAFPFDVVQPGYKVKFISRGGASAANVPESDLGARANGEGLPVLLSDAREMSEQLPDSTTILYLDADREYDNGEQTLHQPGGSGISERRLELALVMTNDEAARAADVLNKKERAERNALAFSLPPIWRRLEPADVVTINHRNRSVDVRLTHIDYLPDGRLECKAVPTSVASYSSTATGSPPTVTEQLTVPLRGTTKSVLLDVPRIVSVQDAPGISAALYGQASGWPGGILMRSDDGGQTWPSMTGFSSRSEVFTASGVLDAGRCDIIDASSSVTVTPNWDGADLFSISESQMLAGGNLAAFGADGRWEILAFKTVIDNSGSYTLRDFMRGRYGTEWAAPLHQAGDQLIMFNTSDADFIGLPLAALNSARLWRAVTNNADINAAEDISHTYTGVNLKPLSPVYTSVTRHPVTFDTEIAFIPRSRTPTEPFSGVAMPVGETASLYEVEIWDSAFATRKRLFSGLTSPSVSYSSANQISDFGANQITYYLRIYQISPTVGRGYACQASVTSYLDDDPYLANVGLLMHFNGTNGSTTFTDQCGRTVTPSGDAQISTAQSVFGGASGSFGGTGYLTVTTHAALQVGSGDFTIEGRVRLGSLAVSQAIMDRRAALAARGISIVFDPAGGPKLIFYVGDTNTSGWELVFSSGAVAANTWYGFALQRIGNVFTAFVDGVSIGSATWAGTPADDTSNWLIGAVIGGGGKLTGHVDEVRITKGVGRYVGNYSLATVEFQNP